MINKKRGDWGFIPCQSALGAKLRRQSPTTIFPSFLLPIGTHAPQGIQEGYSLSIPKRRRQRLIAVLLKSSFQKRFAHAYLPLERLLNRSKPFENSRVQLTRHPCLLACSKNEFYLIEKRGHKSGIKIEGLA